MNNTEIIPLIIMVMFGLMLMYAAYRALGVLGLVLAMLMINLLGLLLGLL